MFLGGCGGGSGVAVPPDVSLQLAAKAHEFIKVSALLFSQPTSFWGQGLRTLYYSALTLARLKNASALHDATENFHSKVWQLSTVSIRKYFDKIMKRVRTKYDYGVNISNDEPNSDLDSFICIGLEPFESLLNQAEISIARDYKRCTRNIERCEYCAISKPIACMKEAAMTELMATRTVLSDIVLEVQARKQK